MPINFELTFTQPLLLQLDFGKIGNSDAMSKAITNAYVTTLLTGLPAGGGIPPALPAPGLTVPPAPPPPYPLPAIPIVAFQSRQRAMQRILKVYFLLREQLGLQGDILTVVRSIAALVAKARNIKKEIKKLAKEIAQLQKRLKELPQTLATIKAIVIQIIKEEQAKIELLYSGLDEFRLILTPQEFQSKFSRELQLIETIKSFKVTMSLQDLDRVLSTLTDIENYLINVPEFDQSSELGAERSIKRYIAIQIQSTLRLIVALTNSVVSPDAYVGYINDIASVDNRFIPIRDAINDYLYIKRLLQPQLNKLKQKKEDLIIKLKQNVETKIADQKQKLKAKKQELAKKKSANKGKSAQFLKAAKTISDTKKKYIKGIRNVKAKVTSVKTIIRTISSIAKGIETIKSDVSRVYTQDISTFIAEIKQVPATTTVVGDIARIFTVDEIRDALLEYLNEVGIRDTKIQNMLMAQVVGKIPTPQYFFDFMERKSENFLNVFTSIVRLERDIVTLDSELTFLLTGQRKAVRQQKQPTEMTALELISYLLNKVTKYVTKLQMKVREYGVVLNNKIKEKLITLVDEVKKQIILLLPIKSDVADPKNKVAVVKSKKDKIKHTKRIIVRRIRQQTLLVKAFKAMIPLLNNITNGNIKYTQNGNYINTVITNVYGFKLLESPQNSQAIVAEQRRVQQNIYDYYYGAELLYEFVVEMVEYFTKSPVLQDIQSYINRETNYIVKQQYVDFYDIVKKLLTLKGKSVKDVIQLVRSLDFRIFESSHVQTLLLALESAYLAPVRAKYEQLEFNPLLKRVAPVKPFQETMIVSFLSSLMSLVMKGYNLLKEKVYNKFIKPQLDKVREVIKKVQDSLKAELKKLNMRKVNLDAKLMSIAFNLATRAFWTGFSWITPNGVRYTTINIPPFLPIKGLADDGASALIRQIAKNLNTQLIGMNGLVTPPPFTAIPPFPFVSYQ